MIKRNRAVMTPVMEYRMIRATLVLGVGLTLELPGSAPALSD